MKLSIRFNRIDISVGGSRDMQDVDRTFIPRQMVAHDHAWRRVSSAGEEPGLLEGRYRCELCGAEWAL
jgi:hypothetical protein